MGMTMVEKILAAHTGKEKVKPGELINAKLDIVLGNDVTTPVAIHEFDKIGVDGVFDKERVVIVPDHFAPNKDINSAEQCKFIRDFAHEKEVVNYFEIGDMGIEHCLLPEQGLVVPGDVIIGADSHTCTYGALGSFATGVGSTDMAAGMATGEAWFKVPETIKFVYTGELNEWVGGKDLILYTIGDIGVDGALYKAMEFSGEVIEDLSMDHRFTMSNMAIEAGGKCGLIEPDQTTIDYIEDRAQREYTLYESDEDAEYEEVIEYDVSEIEPQVAFPHLPENTKGISEVEDIKIDQAVIGSCTNGRIEDLRLAAKILEGKRKADNVRLIIFPGTQEIYKQAMKEGLIEIFIDAGAAVSTPTCGPCLGGHMGILAKGERAIATTNRNFVGRMGHPESEVYLSNPAVAAASAIKGEIVSPEEVM
ncbi:MULTISPECIES: 3-isopropylmalate dehydratase large subunit [unclassified Candidatus Frackibacter]|uniref:3-isopropylmalate dehydratase large subunit n=1 Tax=unclassified Candidatus Frackibacter TaxID=2648818 RepID=UPI00088A74DF|nr:MULTISPECIES: 3-isopropylmalate dehydratase large subunit [unclassified Candidatus Frackibacter]SDC23174.1 3-isopropylmalate dehydratase, large subunit [Candidatus Frackibacter sp. WG11]SEM48735.1 3-isopropylmalate dehydratase, large subunit [Candidatus Frackibacter sp. WG12]SFL50499.1 3-isopropylmalate dehydratase, large subunit [Candidatus Frackibacter sp. WG13]